MQQGERDGGQVPGRLIGEDRLARHPGAWDWQQRDALVAGGAALRVLSRSETKDPDNTREQEHEEYPGHGLSDHVLARHVGCAPRKTGTRSCRPYDQVARRGTCCLACTYR